MVKRLLCMISGMNTGGAETFLMKLYRRIDKSKYQFDFCVNLEEKGYYDDEIIGMGGRIFTIPSKSESVKKFSHNLSEIIKNERYEYVMRVTSNAMGFMEMKIAKKAGAKVCAVRSSNSSDGGSKKALIAHRLGRLLYGRYVDVKIAPSDLAAKYTFGDKSFFAGEVLMLNNGLDLKQFTFSEVGRQNIRAEFGLQQDQLLFGNIGRLMEQKNHKFLLEIFAKILEQKPNSKLLIVGDGVLKEEIKSQAKTLGIFDSVIFAGVRSDIPDILSAMDVMVMPSFYEGMPNTVIEAQATGLPCVIADTITREADITGLVEFMPLGEPHKWAETVISKISGVRKDTHGDFVSKGYDIDTVTSEFIKAIFGE